MTDYRRTRDFYAGLLGMAVANDNGKDACELHFGDPRGVGVRDRQMISIQNRPAARVDHFAFKIDDWDTDRVRAELERRGLKPRLARGGAIDTPNYVSLTVQDPDGLGVQISGIARPGDSAYPGRSGASCRLEGLYTLESETAATAPARTRLPTCSAVSRPAACSSATATSA